MRISRSILTTGLIVAAGLATAAIAAEKIHVMAVRLPDGSVEHIRYTGDVAPRVVLVPRTVAMAPMMPPMPMMSAFGADSPFAALDRISAEMDRQSAQMMHEVAAMQAQARQGTPGMQMVAGGTLPAGARYSYVSTTTVNGKSCTTSVSMSAAGQGQQPQMLRKTSGDCSAVKPPQGLAPTAMPVPPAPPRVPTLVSAPLPPKAPPAPRAVPAVPKVPAVPAVPAPDTI